MANLNETISTFVIIELIDVTSAKTFIFSVVFYTRLAVSKWIAHRSFSMGGVLGYPTSFLVDTWQAKQYEVLPLPALDNGQVNRSDSHFQNVIRSVHFMLKPEIRNPFVETSDL